MAKIKTKLSEGVLLKAGSVTIGGVISITVGGWTKAEIDDTDLDNASVKTKVLSVLKEQSDLTFTVKLLGGSSVPQSATNWTVVFGTSGTYSTYGQLKTLGDVKIDVEAGITRDITIAQTGLDASGNEIAATDPFIGA